MIYVASSMMVIFLHGAQWMAISPWTDFFKQALDVLFRSQCPLCDRTSAQLFCPDCTRRLLACQCDQPAFLVPDLPPLYSWGVYEGQLKQTLAKLKYDRQPRIAEPLGHWLAQCWLDQQSSHSNCFVVPIPLHGDRQRDRGYNQADLIARSFCQVTGLPLKSQGLIRIQSTAPQYGLTRGDRFRNLQNVFRLGPDLQKTPTQHRIILIDDIFTTGATCKSAITTLKHHGFQVIALFTVAVTEGRTRNPTAKG